jgi:hypothetical protein
MTFEQKISAYTLGLLTDKDLSDIAITGLNEGYNSESLRILAGHNSSENSFVLNEHFQNVLNELQITLKERKLALIDVVRFYVLNIVEKEADVYLEFEKIHEMINETEFYFHDIGLMPCYADYISIWEVEVAGLPQINGFYLHVGREKVEFIDKTKMEMKTFLREWLIVHGGT